MLAKICVGDSLLGESRSRGLKISQNQSSRGGPVWIVVLRESSGGFVRKDFVFQPLSKESRALWCLMLRECIELLGHPKMFFVFLNPFGGKGDVVKPILKDAEIKVINGLLKRDDWADATKTPLGVVPAGTGNGMVKSLLHSTGDPSQHAMLLLCLIDIESEKYRWIGSARLDFYATRYDELLNTQRHGYQGLNINLKDLNNVPWGVENTLAAPDAKVKAFILKPGARLEEPSKEGIIDADGEVLAMGERNLL